MVSFDFGLELDMELMQSLYSYCGMSMSNGASNTTLLDASRCASACPDKSVTETCGGAYTLNLFENTALYSAAPATRRRRGIAGRLLA